MDNGGWLVIMMLGGTGVMFLSVAFARKPPPSIMQNGWRKMAEELQQQLQDAQQTSQKLKREVAQLHAQIEEMGNDNTNLERRCIYWRERYLSGQE